MEEIGPVDYAIIAFPGNKFRGEIAPAIGDLVDDGTIRIIDIAFVAKDSDGSTVAMELLDLDPDVQEGLAKLDIEVSGLFSDEDLIGRGGGARAELVGGTPDLGERVGAQGRPVDARRRWRPGRVRADPARHRPGSAGAGAGRPANA